MEASHKNMDFEIVDSGVHMKARIGKLFFFEAVSHQMLQHVSFLFSGFLMASPSLWGGVAKCLRLECIKAGCNVVLRGSRGTS